MVSIDFKVFEHTHELISLCHVCGLQTILAILTGACPAAVQVLAAVLTSMKRESMVALRNRVLVDELPIASVIAFCPQAARLPEVAAEVQAEGIATSAIRSPPP